jgi:folate-binding protein YgfZ
VADLAETAIAALPQLRATLALGGNAAWRLADIHAGVPQVTQPTQEQFVPQMVNFELIGGVNFKKGCYPGQEIVARSQYLGKLKRRMVLATPAECGRACRRRSVFERRPRSALRHDRQRRAERRRRRRRAGRDQAGRAGTRCATARPAARRWRFLPLPYASTRRRLTPAMIDLYVYYKVREPTPPPSRRACARCRRRWPRAMGVAHQLKRRPASQDGLQTWMEVYPGVADALPSLAQAAAQAGLGDWLAARAAPKFSST